MSAITAENKQILRGMLADAKQTIHEFIDGEISSWSPSDRARVGEAGQVVMQRSGRLRAYTAQERLQAYRRVSAMMRKRDRQRAKRRL